MVDEREQTEEEQVAQLDNLIAKANEAKARSPPQEVAQLDNLIAKANEAKARIIAEGHIIKSDLVPDIQEEIDWNKLAKDPDKLIVEAMRMAAGIAKQGAEYLKGAIPPPPDRFHAAVRIHLANGDEVNFNFTENTIAKAKEWIQAIQKAFDDTRKTQ